MGGDVSHDIVWNPWGRFFRRNGFTDFFRIGFFGGPDNNSCGSANADLAQNRIDRGLLPDHDPLGQTQPSTPRDADLSARWHGSIAKRLSTRP